MQNVWELRRKLLLEVDFDTLISYCQVDKLSTQICNSPDFWTQWYINNGMHPPLNIQNNYLANILYIRARKILDLIHSGIFVLTEEVEPDIGDEDFSAENEDILDIIQKLSIDSDNIILNYYEGVLYISSGIVFEYNNCIRSTAVDKSQMIKFIQFLLLLDVKMWFIKNTKYITRPHANDKLERAAEFSYSV